MGSRRSLSPGGLAGKGRDETFVIIIRRSPESADGSHTGRHGGLVADDDDENTANHMHGYYLKMAGGHGYEVENEIEGK